MEDGCARDHATSQACEQAPPASATRMVAIPPLAAALPNGQEGSDTTN
jgi:hypothetical protein